MPPIETAPQPIPETIPEEWVTELEAMSDPAERLAMEQTMRELGGLSLMSQVETAPEEVEAPLPLVPPGYRSMETVVGGATIDMKQFEGSIFSFANPTAELRTDVIKLVTDQGKAVNVCDLRGQMTKQVQKNGPQDPVLRKLLQRDTYVDIKNQVETGRGGKDVQSAPGVRYSSRSNTKARAYWMLGHHKESEQGVPTVFILAECDNSVNSEKDLYRKVFKKKM